MVNTKLTKCLSPLTISVTGSEWATADNEDVALDESILAKLSTLLDKKVTVVKSKETCDYNINACKCTDVGEDVEYESTFELLRVYSECGESLTWTKRG